METSQNTAPADTAPPTDWFREGYEKGKDFARYEADYDELAAVSRAGTIPAGWDIYRAETRNRYLGIKGFDFQAYAKGFAQACKEFFENI